MQPTVLVPVSSDVGQVDACLASLDRSLPDATAVLVFDTSGHPQAEALVQGWCRGTRMDARLATGERHPGFASALAAALDASTGDVLLLRSDASIFPGLFEQLRRTVDAHPRAATLTPWSNHADLCSVPRFGEINPVPGSPELVAEAAAGLACDEAHDLPAAVGSCVLLRRRALEAIGGLDERTFQGARVLDDLFRRAAAMGWRNLLCANAYVLRDPEPGRAAGPPGTVVAEWAMPGAESQHRSDADDLTRLLSRWPDYQEQVARFILSDPLQLLRDRLQTRIDALSARGPQRDLFL